jgi:hypothetical protein
VGDGIEVAVDVVLVEVVAVVDGKAIVSGYKESHIESSTVKRDYLGN